MAQQGDKNKLVAGIFALVLGSLGVHKFYLGKTFQGILYLIFSWSMIPGLIGFVEGIMYLTMSDEDFDLKYNMKGQNRLLHKERTELERDKIRLERLRLERQRLEEEQHLRQQKGQINEKIAVDNITGEQADELAAWHDLLRQGIITEDEYEEKRKAILRLL